MAEGKTRQKSPPEQKDELQALLYQYQLLSAQAEMLQKQNELLSTTLEEINNTIKTLGDMKGIQKGQEIMVPMGAGIFASGTIQEAERLLVNIGADTLCKKSASEALEIMEKRKAHLDEIMKKLSQDLAKTQLGLAALEPELQKLVEKQKG